MGAGHHRGVNTVIVGTGPLSFADVVEVARAGAVVALAEEAEAEIAASRKVIETLADDRDRKSVV